MVTDSAVREAARDGLARGLRVELVTLSEVRGSVPREAGTRMIVVGEATLPGRGRALGTIGGGRLEQQAIERASQRLRLSQPQSEDVTLSLGPSLGQCCGGWVRVRHERLDEATMAAWPRTAPRFSLQLYGAGHVGRAIVQVLHGVDCHVRWIDDREDAFEGTSPSPLAEVERVPTDDPCGEVATAPPGALHLVLTHSHDLDLRLCEAVLRRGDFGFLGLIGSRTKHQRFVHRLVDRGLDPALVARLTCPIGLPGLTGKAPGVVAVSAVAQLLVISSR
jgi:xanthine dehydrogenase accessory factor